VNFTIFCLQLFKKAHKKCTFLTFFHFSEFFLAFSPSKYIEEEKIWLKHIFYAV